MDDARIDCRRNDRLLRRKMADVPFRPRRLRERESSAVDRVEKTSAVLFPGLVGQRWTRLVRSKKLESLPR